MGVELLDQLLGLKNRAPRISIVIPAYNVEAYVREALASVLAQTAPAYEVIIIDDGSTDATYDILTSFVSEPVVQLHRQANRGQGPTRNRGASLVGGDYLYFFDADDVLDCRFVERMQQTIGEGPQPDVVLFSAESFTRTPGLEDRLQSYDRCASGVGLDSTQAIKNLVDKRGSIHATPCLYIVSLSLWHASNLAFPATLYEDENVIMRLLFAASSITILDEVLYYRRYRHDSTMTSTWRLAHVLGREHNLRQAIDTIECCPTADRAVRKVLRDRCRSMAKDYVRRSKAVGRPAQTSLLLHAAIKSRSGKIFKKWLRRVFAHY